ncbi:MAG: TonB-dependent receptor, partial [Acidobacteria bacterium]|nr:TonB-dependent receptor [Acidobacteriota bacterium]
NYRSLGWFNQLEYTPIRYLRLSGGFRVDNWQTEAFSSKGFPAGSEGYILTQALPLIKANPGQANVKGVEGIDSLLTGQGTLSTDKTVTTGNIGLTVLTPIGVNPYVRYGTSYREPEATVRYLIRNFGSPVFSIPSLPNTEIDSERGRSLDTGVKIEQRQFRASLGYFKNDIKNFSQTIMTPTYCIPANPALGVVGTPFPPCSFTKSHAALFFQRISRDAKAHFSGWEFTGEAGIPLGEMGSITPFVALSWLKSVDDAPTANSLKIWDKYHGRSDIPIKIENDRDEIPASDIVPVQGSISARYTDRKGRIWAEWEFRFANEITRLNLESALATANYTQFGGVRSLEGFKKHTLRGGYRLTQGQIPVSFTIAMENVNNALFFLPYQNAPAPGRSIIFGLTFEWKDIFNRENRP